MNFIHKFFLILAAGFIFSACSFKAKSVAQDPILDSDMFKQKATVAGPPKNYKATPAATNNLNPDPIGPELQIATHSDSPS